MTEAVTPKAAPIRHDIAVRVLEYLTEQGPETVVKVGDVCAATGLKTNQVQTAMYRILRDRRFPVEIIQSGRIWRTAASAPGKSAQKADSETFSAAIIERAGGHLIVRDGDGYLYIVKRLGLAGE